MHDDAFLMAAMMGARVTIMRNTAVPDRRPMAAKYTVLLNNHDVTEQYFDTRRVYAVEVVRGVTAEQFDIADYFLRYDPDRKE